MSEFLSGIIRTHSHCGPAARRLPLASSLRFRHLLFLKPREPVVMICSGGETWMIVPHQHYSDFVAAVSSSSCSCSCMHVPALPLPLPLLLPLPLPLPVHGLLRLVGARGSIHCGRCVHSATAMCCSCRTSRLCSNRKPTAQKVPYAGLSSESRVHVRAHVRVSIPCAGAHY